jgi:hypothetical protein
MLIGVGERRPYTELGENFRGYRTHTEAGFGLTRARHLLVAKRRTRTALQREHS